MGWAAWVFAEGRPDCTDCRDLHRDNGEEPPCATCAMPQAMPRRVYEAWAAWVELDNYGRPVDSFGGFPLPLRLEDIERVCARSDDPDGLRWRVMLIEEKALEARRAAWERKHKK